MKGIALNHHRWFSPNIALITLLIGSCAAGSAALFAKISPLDPIVTTFWRFALATPVFLLILMTTRAPKTAEARADALQFWPQHWRDWGLMGLAGVCFAGAQMLWFLGLEHSSVANATLLLALTPLIAGAVLGLWFAEPIGRSFWLGMGIALSGVGGLSAISAQQPGLMLYGDLLCLGSAVCLSGYFMCLARLRRRFRAMPVMALSALACTLVMLVTVAIRPAPVMPVSAEAWAVVMGLALVSQIFGHGLMTISIGFVAGRLAAVSVLIQPVWASALGWWLLGEALTVAAVFSGFMVLCGIWLSNRGSHQKPPIIGK